LPGSQGNPGIQGIQGVGVTDASIGQPCAKDALPGLFVWVESSPGSNIFVMGCQLPA
jgi:hypothetical protein